MSQEGLWVEVIITTSSEAVEAVSAILYNLGVAGVAIEDPNDIWNSNTSPGDWDYIDENLLPKDTDNVYVKGYFPQNADIESKVQYIRDAVKKLEEYGIDSGKGEVATRKVFEQDWANAWKQYYKPFKIGDHIVIKPTWEDYDTQADDILIEIDPGMAFGTGTHETTRMCIELLEEYVKKGITVFDIGCGSGILSIVSSKLGASKVTGVDIDPVAVKTSLENIRVSGAENIEIINGNLLDVVKGKADLVAANIIADVIINLAPVIPGFLVPGGIFISSGIIKERAEDVEKALLNSGFSILNKKEMGEWVALALKVGE